MNPASTTGRTLWIIEDDPRMRELAYAAAERSGHFSRVEVAQDGQDAWDRLLAQAAGDLPDVLLTDLSMPRLDGLALVSRIKGHPVFSGIPILMFSSSNRPNDEVDALAAGCSLFVEKPVRFDALEEVMRKASELAENVEV